MGNRHARNQKHDVTHWPTSVGSFDGYDFGAPEVIKGRWEDRAVLFRDGGGEERTSRAVVYLASDVDIGDYITLGDLSTVADPTTLTEAFRVMQFSKITNLRNIETIRKAYI